MERVTTQQESWKADDQGSKSQGDVCRGKERVWGPRALMSEKVDLGLIPHLSTSVKVIIN